MYPVPSADVALRLEVVSAEMDESELKRIPALNPEGGYVKIALTDNGIGFKQEHAQNIFDIFFRLHDKNHFEGSGIGLAMAKKIVQNHRGEIYAYSGEDEGSVFTIILPKQ